MTLLTLSLGFFACNTQFETERETKFEDQLLKFHWVHSNPEIIEEVYIKRYLIETCVGLSSNESLVKSIITYKKEREISDFPIVESAAECATIVEGE
tara:strand:+ start:945 stop:1235 length:291 start_codon:yes stop_codon:yes gene_type:complete